METTSSQGDNNEGKLIGYFFVVGANKKFETVQNTKVQGKQSIFL
jgi:hypothetical protein